MVGITKFSTKKKGMKLNQKQKSGEVSNVQTPESVKKMISSDKVQKVRTTIHGASLTAAGVGALPLPIADALILVPIQLRMLRKIYKIYGEKFNDKFVVNFIRVTLIPYIGRSLSRLIPGVGNVINASIAAAITEAIGWSAAVSLEKGIDITKDTEKFEGLVMDMLKNIMKRTK
ncbi:hypothetical protein AALA52_07100 [Lactococcus ileimucosae]|uniref:DUF697 domain-containing protein n=1 Tax=Lactococcus ileimucosae TaxID=2941329 RepID=A0ABV4D569_9LACT